MSLIRSECYLSTVLMLTVPLTARLFFANEEEENRFVKIYGNQPLTSGKWEWIRKYALLDDDGELRAIAYAAHILAYPSIAGQFTVDSAIFGTAILSFQAHYPIQIDLLKYVTASVSYFITKGELEENTAYYLVKVDDEGTIFRLGRHVTPVIPRQPQTNTVAVTTPEDLPHLPPNLMAVDPPIVLWDLNSDSDDEIEWLDCEPEDGLALGDLFTEITPETALTTSVAHIQENRASERMVNSKMKRSVEEPVTGSTSADVSIACVLEGDNTSAKKPRTTNESSVEEAPAPAELALVSPAERATSEPFTRRRVEDVSEAVGTGRVAVETPSVLNSDTTTADSMMEEKEVARELS